MPVHTSRRGVMCALTGFGLAGCGFHPVYGPYGGRESAVLGQIFVPPIPERSGQLLRQALQQRLTAGGGDGAKHFILAVNFGLAADAIGIQQDTSSSRIRYAATASWILRRSDPGQTVVTNGVARGLDGVNITDQQFFAADLEGEAVQRRIADNIASAITVQLAAYFSNHPDLA